ncbi:hypothetical protein C2E23DRAFT_820117 [Lenzites betulinus]|nr:hypothetical protein C2E23DRAFT_820117 [Lenzites betulinus]
MEPSPTPSDPGDFTGYQHVLAGYTHQDFPDLSSRRFAPETARSISQALTLDAGLSASKALAIITVAVGRVLGAYCGCTDVLLAVADPREAKLRPVRVTWGDGQTWSTAVDGVARALADENWPRVSLESLRTSMDLSSKQSPCLALLGAHPIRFPQLGDGIPVVVTVDRDNAALSVSASERSCHPSQSQLLASQVDALVGNAFAEPRTPLALLPRLSGELLSSYDKHSFEECSRIYAPVPSVKFATDHLRLQAIQRPDSVAVRWYADLSTDTPSDSYIPDSITYAELDRKVDQIAGWLRSIGIEKGNAVAVCMKRDIWFHIVFLGILRAGGCYVPIDSELPIERQQFIARDSHARQILSSSELPCFASLGDTVIDIKDPSVQATIDGYNADGVDEPNPEDSSYILYTSGTTGTPKGCILTQRGLVEAVWALSGICASVKLENPSDGNYLSIASVAFDVHLAEIFVPLALGIPILSAPRSLLLEDLPHYISNLHVSHVGIVPSLIEATMGAVQEDEKSGHGSSLRYIASGGEKMSDAILDKWASHPTIRLANFYGPSEVTIGCAARIMDKDTPRANIGHTFANVGAYVVDENMNILLRGGTGELVVEGPLVGRGYVGRPDLTQKVFLKFPDDGTERWAYRTGDLVRMMPDATLEIIGRIDTQIKLRGVRIESEGISSILRNAVAPKRNLDAITILAKHPAIGIDQLVSFVAWDPTVPIATRKGGKPVLASPPNDLLSRLRSACDRELASYMRPSHIVPLRYLPLSSNGKADAKVLTAFFLGLKLETLTELMSSGRPSRSSKRDERREPTRVERQILDVLKVYVKMSVDALSPHTNIFECGMDSLAVARFAGDLRKNLHVQVSPAQIMQRPEVCEIAALLQGGSASVVIRNGPSPFEQFAQAVARDVEGAYPLDSIGSLLPPFPVQEGVLYRSVNLPTMYVQHVLLRLSPGTAVLDLRKAWIELVEQHEMLRTVFHFGSDLVQVVLHAASVKVDFTEKQVQVLDDLAFQQYFGSEEASSIARELNLGISKTPPVRVSFYPAPAPGTTYMVLSIHHALYDGISLPVLLRNFERAYSGKRQLASAPLRSVLEPIIAIDQTAGREFWASYLKGFAWRGLLNKPASAHRADVASIPLKRSLSDLQAKAASRQITLQALLMSAYGYLLGERLYESDDVMFGVIRSGRALPVNDIDTTICPMITVLPARARYDDATKVLHTVQHDIARVGEFEHIPLSRIQKWIPESNGSLFDTLFSVSFKERDDSTLWSVVESQNPEPDYILAVEVVLDPEQDQAVAYAAFTAADIPPDLVNDILGRLEETAVLMVDNNDWGLPASNGGNPGRTPRSALSDGHSTDDASMDIDVDEDVVAKIRDVAARFLRISHDLIAGDTSLLSLGLDSIKSVGLSRKFSNEGLKLSSADIMRYSTPHRLAAYIKLAKTPAPSDEGRMLSSFSAERDALISATNVAKFKLSADDEVAIFPTTTLQAGMLSQTVGSHGRLYVHLFPLRLDKSVDVGRLRKAWEKAIRAFDILRTSFHFLAGPGLWAQIVHSATALRWSEGVYDVGTNLAESLNPYVNVADENEYFQEPPVFLHYLKAAAPAVADHLVLVLHHALYDGLSIAKLLDAVEQLYNGVDISAAVRYHGLLPSLLWQEKNGTNFWVDRLQDLKHAPIPKELPANASPAVHKLTLPIRPPVQDIQRAGRSAEVTPQCLGQAAFAKLLAVVTQSPDVIFGRVVSGRDVPGAEDVIGPMLNTVPCRVTFDPAMTNKALLRTLHESNITSMAWQHASLRAIQRRLGISNLWDSIFVFQPKQESLESDSHRLWNFDPSDSEDISIHYPLNIELHEEGDRYVVQAACASDVTDAQGLTALAERYAAFLSGIVNHLDEPCAMGIRDLPTSLPSERARPSMVVGDTSQKWDSRFDAFRDVVSVVTKVPPPKIQTTTPLATLGIDSITAVQLVAKARRVGLYLASSDVVQSQTIGDLLLKLKNTKPQATNGNSRVAVSIDIPRKRWPTLLARYRPSTVDLVERIIPASPGMEWMIGMWQGSGGSRFQHVFGYRLPTTADSAKLEMAWDALLQRHAILRSTFVYDADDAAPRIVVFKSEGMQSSWSSETLEDLDDGLALVEQRMRDLVSHPPSVALPITRALLLQSTRSAYLLIHLHHFQYDAWSLQLLVDDLTRLYSGEALGCSNDLDGFLRFTAPNPETNQQQSRYWKANFAAAKGCALFPSLSVSPDAHGRSVYTDRTALCDAARLARRAQDLAVSLQSVFLACWARVQNKYAGSDGAVFSLWHSGRTGELSDLERLAIPCINVLPYSVSIPRGADDLALARRIQQDLQKRSAVVEHSRLVKVHEWVGVAGKPLSNVFVNIIKVAPDVARDGTPLLAPIDVPYYIPQTPSEAAAAMEKMRITEHVQDDVMIDIALLEKTDTVAMSIESMATVLDSRTAKSLVEEWAVLVKSCLAIL